MMEHFLRERRGRYYIFEKCIYPKGTVIVEIPLSIYKSSLNDIGFASSDEEVSFYITYSTNPEGSCAIWQRADGKNINRASRAVKIINHTNKLQTACIRIAF